MNGGTCLKFGGSPECCCAEGFYGDVVESRKLLVMMNLVKMECVC